MTLPTSARSAWWALTNSWTRCSWDWLGTGGCAMNGSFSRLGMIHHRGAPYPRQLLAPSFTTPMRSAAGISLSVTHATPETRAKRTRKPRAPRLTRCGSIDRAARSAEARCQSHVRREVAVGLAIGAEARVDTLSTRDSEPGAEVGIPQQAIGLRGQLLRRAEQEAGDRVLDE